MKPIERRIQAMEAALAPPPQGPVILEAGNGLELQGQLAQARASGVRVIVAHRDWPVHQKAVVDGVVHIAWAVAVFEYCAGMPSQEGRRNLLEDMIHGLQGNVIGPTLLPREGLPGLWRPGDGAACPFAHSLEPPRVPAYGHQGTLREDDPGVVEYQPT